MKAYYITTESQDVFYVRAEGVDHAKEILEEGIRKYLFKYALAGDQTLATPAMLGENIIVGYVVRASQLTERWIIEDITPQAYVFSDQSEDYFKDWVFTKEDVCQK